MVARIAKRRSSARWHLVKAHVDHRDSFPPGHPHHVAHGLVAFRFACGRRVPLSALKDAAKGEEGLSMTRCVNCWRRSDLWQWRRDVSSPAWSFWQKETRATTA